MKRLLLVAVLAAGLTGCAEAARVNQMTAWPTTPLPAASSLQHTVQVTGVSGGTKTNPMWLSKVGDPEFQSALTASLGAAGMLASGEGRYRLDAKLLQLKQPMMGFDLAVDSRVHYTLTEAATGRTVFDRDVIASHTATMKDAFLAVQRLQLANEGSIRKNIQQFMDELIVETAKGPAISAITLTNRGG